MRASIDKRYELRVGDANAREVEFLIHPRDINRHDLRRWPQLRGHGRFEFRCQRTLAASMRRVASWLFDSERARPHLTWLVSSLAVRLVGTLCSVLAVVVLLPIPFGNMPPAFAISLCAYGIFGRDGRWILAGIAAGAASLALGWSVVYALVDVGFDWLRRAPTKLSGV